MGRNYGPGCRSDRNTGVSPVCVCVCARASCGALGPAALCQVVSLGSINQKNNSKASASISKLLEEFKIPNSRVYTTQAPRWAP